MVLSRVLTLCSYRIAYGARTGVDGYFFRHFSLSKQIVLNAVRSSPDDAAVAQRFLQQPGITPARIAEWNRLAPLLGAKGHPGYVTRRLVTLSLYPKTITPPFRRRPEREKGDRVLPREIGRVSFRKHLKD